MGTIVAASGGGDVGGDGDMIGSFFKVELSRSFTWFRNWSAGWMVGGFFVTSQMMRARGGCKC